MLQAIKLKKTFIQGTLQVEALKGVSMEINKSEFISVMGPSGSGKSTLLHLLGGLDVPTSGQVVFENQQIEKLSDNELSTFRRRHLGFIFQFFNLLPTLTAIENVMFPALLDGKKKSVVRSRADSLLKLVGLTSRADHLPHQLSGGEMQRVAIARALVADPYLVLADEPTGNLDSKTGASVLELLQELALKHGHTIVMVTHDSRAASFGNRLVLLRDGLIESDRKDFKL